MELRNMMDVENFKMVLNNCVGDVWMKSTADGSRFDLKNEIAQDVVIGRMLNGMGSDLELFAGTREDEGRLIGFMCDLHAAA